MIINCTFSIAHAMEECSFCYCSISQEIPFVVRKSHLLDDIAA